MVGAAKKRGDTLNHVLLSGPPGLGKTTLAFILRHELGRNVRVTSGPVVEKAGDLAGLLTNLEEGDILFIDEIHRIPKTVEEYLYSAMEDFRIDIIIDQGPNARSVRLTLPRFTLIGATTRAGLLTAPLRSRFTLQTRLDYYDKATLHSIVRRTCALLKVEIGEGGASEIAKRARGTPRVANNLINFVRDFAQEPAPVDIITRDGRRRRPRAPPDRRRRARRDGQAHATGPWPRITAAARLGMSTIAVRGREGVGDTRGGARALPHPGRLSPEDPPGARAHREGLRRGRPQAGG